MPSLFSGVRPSSIAVAVAITIGAAIPVYAADRPDYGVIGKWRVTKALDSADISSLDDQEASQLIGRIFTINRKTVRLGRADDCLPPGFDAQLVETTRYVRKWAHASAENLGLPNPVTVVDLGCTSAFIKNRQSIVVFWKGWFFDAKRMR